MFKLLLIILTVFLAAIVTSDIVRIRRDNDEANCFGKSSVVGEILRVIFGSTRKVEENRGVFLNLHSRKEIPPSRPSLSYVDFEPEKKTVFIVHGFRSDGMKDWVKQMADAYLKLEDVNVFAVDWSYYSDIINYSQAVENTKLAAQEILAFIEKFMAARPKQDKWGDIHMIGHSLGAHVSGMTARGLKNLTSKWKVARITGLDPAQPCFVGTGAALNKDDAPFVDIIHTNGKIKIGAGVGLGLRDPIGHMDFYPNGGQDQPGCRSELLKVGKTKIVHTQFQIPLISSFQMFFRRNFANDLDGLPETICSHESSYEYFTESLRLAAGKDKPKFWAHKWNLSPVEAIPLIGQDCNSKDCVEMGIKASEYTQTGIFFVSTSGSENYSALDLSDCEDIADQLMYDGSLWKKFKCNENAGSRNVCTCNVL